MIHIYVGDEILDLKPRTVITLSVMTINVTSLQSRYITYSNSFSLPLTNKNLRILGVLNNESSSTQIPYRFTECRIVSGSVNVLVSANIVISNVTRESINVSIYEQVMDFFTSIRGKKLSDILPITSSAWNAAAIDAARLNTSGEVAAILDWGKSGALYQYDYFLPCFYYHTIIRAILEYTGLTLSGNILSDDGFLDLVIPYPGARFEYDERLNDMNSQASIPDSDVSFGVLSGAPVDVTFQQILYGSSYWDGLDKYVVPETGGGVTLQIDVSFRITIDTWGDGANVTVSIAKDGVTVGSSYTLTDPATDSGVQALSYTGEFLPGEEITLLVEGDAPTSDIGVDVKVGTSITITFDTTVNRDLVNWNVLLPEINCEDLLRDFFTRFGVIPKQVENTLVLKTLEEIITDRAGATDWSTKIVRGIPDIDFELAFYAQSNHFDYEDSDDVSIPGLGRGSIVIDNDTVDLEKTIFKSIFGNSRILIVGDYRVASIPVYDASSTGISTFANEPGLRLLTLKDRTIETAITFDATPRTDYKLAYFVDPVVTKDTGWDYFLTNYYPTLTASLQRSKTLVKYFNLTEIDIANFDPQKMVYDGNGYYLASIKNYIPGKITRVELFKIV